MTSSLSDPLIVAEEISAGYGTKRVLDEISFSIRAGEIVGLLGPNGSGKTTLLKVLCGALNPWSGLVKVDGRDVKALNPKTMARLTAYVPQTEDHAFDFTVRELTLMGRFAFSDGLFESLEDHDAASRAMEEADCAEFADRTLSTLSGGEAQRALIARALAQETPALFCDEPTTHLDPEHQIEIARLLRKLGNEGRAMIVTTHDLNLAASCCDRVLLIKEGRIVYDGSLKDATPGPLEVVFGTKFYCSEGYIWPQR